MQCYTCSSFFFNDTATTEIYTYVHTLSLHDALPISTRRPCTGFCRAAQRGEPAPPSDRGPDRRTAERSEEHTSELQSLMRISYAVFCLKKKQTTTKNNTTEIQATEHINRMKRLTKMHYINSATHSTMARDSTS